MPHRKENMMELTRDEVLTVNTILNLLVNEVPYREVNKYFGDMLLDEAYELLERITEEINLEW